jgi:peptidoglycan/LPS O-acetylase OafA/YrhL
MHSEQSRIGYRPDVDGLRALAVLAVIGFHAFPRFVPGGFVGVDVFFVISGFLISGILFTQCEQGRFDLAGFYVRRIRRILPALIVVLMAVAVVGLLVLTREDYKELQEEIGAGAFFLSNIQFWRSAGYFDAPSELKPLLHLWSLGIEEQFYLMWPPLVYLCWKRRFSVFAVAIAIVVLSFSLNVALITRHAVADFYLPTSRIWELLLGGVLAHVICFRREGQEQPRAANIIGWAGLLLILLAAALLHKGSPYPGWWAALPTMGTALLIWAGAGAWVNRAILSRRSVVYIGLISYPLYLWHWPLLSFLQITEAGSPSSALKASAVGLSFVLAALTYHAVERPIRTSVSRRTPVRIAALVMLLVAVGSTSLYSRRTNTFAPSAPYLIAGIYSRIPSPRHNPSCTRQFTNAEYCQVYNTGMTVTTALVGDSHAEHFFTGVGAHLATRGENVVHLGQSGCPPLMEIERFTVGGSDTCRAFSNGLITYVANHADIKRVILSFKGAVYVTGRGWDVDDVVFRVAGTDLPPEESMKRALVLTVEYLIRHQKEVWLILQVPELRFNLTQCFTRPFSFEKRIRTPCAVPRDSVTVRQAGFRRAVQQVQQQIPSLHVFDPLPYLCDERWCYAILDNELLYVDDNHLSREGSLFFADKFHFDSARTSMASSHQ